MQGSVAAAAAATKSHRRASLLPPPPSTAVGRASWAVSRWVAAVSWPPPSPGYCFPARSELSGFEATGAGQFGYLDVSSV